MSLRIPLTAGIAAFLPQQAMAASGPFFSLGNTNFVVTISFVLFIGAIIYFKAPMFAGKLIDGRIDAIRKQIEEARSLRDEAQSNLDKAKSERAEAADQAERLIASAETSAKTMIEEAETAIDAAVKHRLQTAEDQIATAEADAVAVIRNEAIDIAVAAASEVIASSLTAEDRTELVSSSITEIDAKLQ